MQRTVVLAKKLLARLRFLAQEVMPFLLCILSYILDPSRPLGRRNSCPLGDTCFLWCT
jgi:hypothetical protein